jgi:NAD-dependent dihydropyrimidine dehydrogenase PreA subunit
MKRNECCGCGVCITVCSYNAINLSLDSEGFLNAFVDDSKCIDCGDCLMVCPIQNHSQVLLCKMPRTVYAAKHKSNEVRTNSSSGGMFTALSDVILLENGKICAAKLQDNFMVEHIVTADTVNRDECRGSKYVQSEIHGIYDSVREALLQDQKLLIVGTPCQIAAVQRYTQWHKLPTERLVLVELICHGVGSGSLFRDYIGYIKKTNGLEILKYQFRTKLSPDTQEQQLIFSSNIIDNKSRLSQAFIDLFWKGLIIRTVCHQCPFTKTDRASDLTIADFWGLEAYEPGFVDSLGVSLTWANTSKGNYYLTKALANCDYKILDADTCLPGQLNLRQPTPANHRRDRFWRDYEHHDIKFALKKYTRYGTANWIKIQSKRAVVLLLYKLGLLRFIKLLIRKRG